jgi:integrase
MIEAEAQRDGDSSANFTKDALSKMCLSSYAKSTERSRLCHDPLKPQLHCPECGSLKLYKDGLRYPDGFEVQRWICRTCGYRFSDPAALKALRNLSKLSLHQRVQTLSTNSLKAKTNIVSNCRIRVEETKNLVSVAELKETAAEISPQTSADIKGKIVEFAFYQKREGRKESTRITRVKLLTVLWKRGANLFDPESVKEAIANQSWCNKRKVNGVDAYAAFLKMMGKTWSPPIYQVTDKLPFIPQESEIDALISGTGRKTSTFLQFLKETAARAGEAHALKPIDIDYENRTITINSPEKGSKPRNIKVSAKLLSMLTTLQMKSDGNHLFSKHLRTQRRVFAKQRANLAKKLQNPRLQQIHFHTFRHWKATIEYHRTRDIFYVKELLGHKSITNTMKYVQLIELGSDEFTSKAATNAKEAAELVEAGFEYVCTTPEPESLMLFRKRK